MQRGRRRLRLPFCVYDHNRARRPTHCHTHTQFSITLTKTTRRPNDQAQQLQITPRHAPRRQKSHCTASMLCVMVDDWMLRSGVAWDVVPGRNMHTMQNRGRLGLASHMRHKPATWQLPLARSAPEGASCVVGQGSASGSMSISSRCGFRLPAGIQPLGRYEYDQTTFDDSAARPQQNGTRRATTPNATGQHRRRHKRGTQCKHTNPCSLYNSVTDNFDMPASTRPNKPQQDHQNYLPRVGSEFHSCSRKLHI